MKLTGLCTDWSEVKSLSRVRLFANTWTHQAPLSMGFSRQEYWSRLPFPLPGNLPHPGSGTRISHIVGKLFTVWAPRGTLVYVCVYICAKTHIKIPHTDCFICKYAYKWKENIVKNNGMWKVAKVVTCKTGDWRGKICYTILIFY